MTKPRKLKNESTDAYNERASKLYYAEGYHIEEIADRLGIDQAEIYNYVVPNGRRITTLAEREEMIALFNQGYSYSAIAKIFKRSRMCVRKRIESPAKVRCASHNKLTDKQLKKMKDMAKDGAYLETIAKEIGIKTSSVQYRLKHTNARKCVKYITKNEIKKFVRLYKQGKSHAEIAEACGRSRSSVNRYLHANDCWRSREK